MESAFLRRGGALSSISGICKTGTLVAAALAMAVPATVQAAEALLPLDFDLADVKGGEPAFEMDLEPKAQLQPVTVHLGNPAARSDTTGPVEEAPLQINDQGQTTDERIRKKLRTLKTLEITYQLLNIADAVQTIACTKSRHCEEGNPMYGHRPSVAAILVAKGAMGLLHYIAYRDFARNTDRLDQGIAVEWISIGLQGAVVGWNMKVIM